MTRHLASALVLAAGLFSAVPVVTYSLPQDTPREAPHAKSDSNAASHDDEGTKVSPKSDKTGAIGVFADIEAAWQKESVDKILVHYGKGKVAIAIEGVGPPGGTFSKSQSHYLLKDLFDYTITEKFEFVQYRNVHNGDTKVYAVAERAYKRNDDGRTFEDKIYVSLHREDDRWVIAEIKSIR